MATSWKDVRASLQLTPEEESIIDIEKALIAAVVEAREQNSLTQKELSQRCGVSQPVIARLERGTHSPQLNSMIRILQPLGYTLAVVPDRHE